MAKRTNNDLQTSIHKTEDRVTRSPLKSGDELMCINQIGAKEGYYYFKNGIFTMNMKTSHFSQYQNSSITVLVWRNMSIYEIDWNSLRTPMLENVDTKFSAHDSFL